MATRINRIRAKFEVYMQLINTPPGAGRTRMAWLMKKQNASERKVAAAAGLTSKTHIHNLLHGRKNTCRPEVAAAIARFLGVAIEDLFVTRVSSSTDQDGRAA